MVITIAVGLANTICGAVLLVAGIMKITGLAAFGQQIAAYQIISARFARLIGYVLPPVEIALGIAMLFVPLLAAAASFLFLSFAAAIGVNLLRGRRELHCGCFGVTGKHKISLAHLIGNAMLALLSALVSFEQRPLSFASFQIGVSVVLLISLASAWRTIAPPRPQSATEALRQWPD